MADPRSASPYAATVGHQPVRQTPLHAYDFPMAVVKRVAPIFPFVTSTRH